MKNIYLFFSLITTAFALEAIRLDSKIYIAGHTGLVGSTILNTLQKKEFANLICEKSSNLDLRDFNAVDKFFAKVQPEYVIVCAAKVGGIQANIKSPVDFIYDNVIIAFNIISAAFKHNVTKLIFFGSSCAYPRNCPQPMLESYLLTGALEPTNQYYAIAKIAGIKLCEAFNKQYGTKYICCMPPNIYGPNDHFNSSNSHVISALISKISKAKQNNNPTVSIWGTGKARREFLYAEDLADVCLFLLNKDTETSLINVGSGEDISIEDLAYKIKNLVGYKGELIFDTSYPDGMPQKLMDSSNVYSLGWKPNVSLDEGLRKTIDFYQSSHSINSCKSY